MKEYKDILTPEELYDWMKYNISYGYLDKFNKVHKPTEDDFNAIWRDVYVLENHSDVLNNKLGNCWDQVEFERIWFLEHGYEVKTIFEMVLLDYDNIYPTHSFLIFKDNNNWCWFENSDASNDGVHKYLSIDDLLNDQLSRYIKFLKNEYNISKEEIDAIKLFEYKEPNNHLSADSYLEFVTSGKRLK